MDIVINGKHYEVNEYSNEDIGNAVKTIEKAMDAIKKYPLELSEEQLIELQKAINKTMSMRKERRPKPYGHKKCKNGWRND